MAGLAPRVLIRGSGTSAWAAAAAAGALGCEVVLAAGQTGPRPAVLLNRVTVRVLQDLIGGIEDLIGHSWVVERRIVRWGQNPEAMVGEPSLAVSARALTEALERDCRSRLGRRIQVQALRAEPAPDVDWEIRAGGDKQRTDLEMVWGRRVVVAAGVRFGRHDMERTAWMETVAGEWLFYFPTSRLAGVVQLMLPAPTDTPRERLQAALARSGLRHRDVRLDEEGAISYRACPALGAHTCERGAVAVGSGAARLDPLCGDGTGFAVRSSLLAAAVIDYSRGTKDLESPIRHYRSRIIGALANHLRACDHFYSETVGDAAWSAEIERGRKGIAELQAAIPAEPCEHRLVERKLVAMRG